MVSLGNYIIKESKMVSVLVADIHIKYLKDYPLFEENRLDKLVEEIKKQSPDQVWILGDFFDSSKPKVKELRLARKFIDSLGVPVMYLEGNHERVNAQSYILKDLEKLLDITPLAYHFKINSTTIAAFGHKDIKDIVDSKNADILLSHFRWTHPLYGYGELRGDENEICRKFNSIILGDIHSNYNPRPNVTYTSSPYTINFSSTQDTGFITLNIYKNGYSFSHIKTHLPNKVKLKVTLNKLSQLMATLDDINLYYIEVEVKNKKELLLFSKVRKPANVITLKPILIEELKETKVTKVEIKDNVLDTFMNCLPKSIEDEKDYIKESIGE